MHPRDRTDRTGADREWADLDRPHVFLLVFISHYTFRNDAPGYHLIALPGRICDSCSLRPSFSQFNNNSTIFVDL